jgi:phenol 2-monooxygenase (NADPH)
MELMQSLGHPIEQLEHMGKKIFGRTFWEISDGKTQRMAFARFFPEFLDFDKDYALAVRQGLIEQVLVHDVENHYDGFSVQWNWAFESLVLPQPGSDSLTTVKISHTKTGEKRVVSTKYVIGCDGARSSVRRWASKDFGVKLEGASLPVTWCVLDAVGLKSDHPDLERLWSVSLSTFSH